MTNGQKILRDRFYCDTCHRPFIDSNALQMHNRRSKAHSTMAPVRADSNSAQNSDSTNLKCRCKVCDKPFKTKKALGNHEISKNHKAIANTLPTRTVHTAASKSAPTTAGNTDNKQQLSVNHISELLSQTSVVRDVKISTKSTEGRQDVFVHTTGVRLPTAHCGEQDATKGTPAYGHPENAPEGLGNWSFIPIKERGLVLDALRTQCHPAERLSKDGYWTQIPTLWDIDMKRKCNDCGVRKGKLEGNLYSVCQFHPAKKAFERGIIRGRGGGAQKAKCVRCQQAGTKGCIILPAHDFAPAEAKLIYLKLSPARNPNARTAVVLDCEMVGVLGPNNSEISELVRISAVDFLSGETLVNTYVEPLERVISWRTRFSGVTRSLLMEMKRQGLTTRSWRAARDLLWQHIDQQTILIGHSLNNDLAVLGMVHTCVVDSAILTHDAVGEDCSRFWGLKTLVQQFLAREIQAGNSGHDCLEDTFATREVLLWCLYNPPQLQDWATAEREIIAQKQKQKQKQKEESVTVAAGDASGRLDVSSVIC